MCNNDIFLSERKLQKHEAFERELRANEGQLRTVNNSGQALISENSSWKDEVAKTLSELNSEWQDLVGLSLRKGRCLRQAVNQHAYNSAVDDVKTKLDEIEDHLNSQNLGNDLRSCKVSFEEYTILNVGMKLYELSRIFCVVTKTW